MSRSVLLAPLSLSVLWLALGSAGCASPPEVRLATFNAGLAPQDIAYVDQRAPRVVEAIAESDADVLCVQEFWRERDMQALRDATRERYPHVVRLDPMPVSTGCSADELDPLQACAQRECPDLAGDALADCALTSCDGAVAALSGACAACVIDEVSAGGDVETIRSECGGDGGEGYLYGGAFDTAILSRDEILEQDSRVLDSYLVRAAVDYALVDTAAGPLHVFCTHLASGIGEFDYEGDHGSWKQEQAHQIEQALSFVEAKTGGSGAAVLLGDLNSRPEIESLGIEAKWEGHYARFIETGWDNPWLEQEDVACTSCPGNTLRGPDANASINDHVLVRQLSGRAQCEQAFAETVTIEVDGELLRSSLSDHYGLACDVAP